MLGLFICIPNNWDLGCLSVAEREWVEANCVAVYVGEPVFQQRDGKRQRLTWL